MSNSFIVTKLDDQKVQLPNGFTINRDQFLTRMGKCGFDTDTTESIFDRINNNGIWMLDLNPRQVSRLNGGSQPRTNGFA